jgi:ABC-2 type transport system ATP-binding protein
VSEPEEILYVEELRVRFGGRAALDGVSMRVPKGAITGLVGPNGAGKTTLIRVLATALLPTSGRVLIAGFDPAREPLAVRRSIGYLPDFMGLYQDMRVVEYLGFFADAYGLDREARRAFVARALRLARLEDRAEAFIEELSLGMRSRVAFARTLAGDPSLLLLDEPLSGLDPFAKADFVEVLKQLRAEGKSVLISSHQLADLERLCDTVVFMDRGRAIEEDGLADASRRAAYELGLSGVDDRFAERLSALPCLARVTSIADVRDAFSVELAEETTPPAALRAIVLAGFDVAWWRPLEASLETRLRRAVGREEGR